MAARSEDAPGLTLAPHSDIEIAVAQTPKPVVNIANEMGLIPDEVESYGKYKAKIELGVLDRLQSRQDGKYIVVAGCVQSAGAATGDAR